MGKPNFISILCLSLALLANPLIGMRYCTVHHHFFGNLDEIHVHAEYHASWFAYDHETHHEAASEICGCAVHEHSGPCESMIPAEFFAQESLLGFFLGDSAAFPAFTLAPVFQESVFRFRPGQNGFLAFSSGKVRTHLLKSVLVI